MSKVTDPYGRLIEVGTEVAYNYSGQVAKGHVLAIKKTRQYNRTNYILTIARTSMFVDGYKRNLESTVNVRNVCVI